MTKAFVKLNFPAPDADFTDNPIQLYAITVQTVAARVIGPVNIDLNDRWKVEVGVRISYDDDPGGFSTNNLELFLMPPDGFGSAYYSTGLNYSYVPSAQDWVPAGFEFDSASVVDVLTLNGPGPWQLKDRPSSTPSLDAFGWIHGIDPNGGEHNLLTSALTRVGTKSYIPATIGYQLYGAVRASYNSSSTGIRYMFDDFYDSDFAENLELLLSQPTNWVLLYDGRVVSTGQLSIVDETTP